MRARARPLFLTTVFQILFPISPSNGKNENPKTDILTLKSVFRFRVRLQIRNPDFKIQIQIFPYECNNTAEQNIKVEDRTKTLRKGGRERKKKGRGEQNQSNTL